MVAAAAVLAVAVTQAQVLTTRVVVRVVQVVRHETFLLGVAKSQTQLLSLVAVVVLQQQAAARVARVAVLALAMVAQTPQAHRHLSPIVAQVAVAVAAQTQAAQAQAV